MNQPVKVVKVIVGGKVVSLPKAAITPVQSSATCVCRDCQFPSRPQ